jgi:hypothetical protein
MKHDRTRRIAAALGSVTLAIACLGCARENKTVTKTTTETPEQKTTVKDVHKERVVDK